MKRIIMVFLGMCCIAGILAAGNGDLIDSGKLERSWTLPALQEAAVEENPEIRTLRSEAEHSRLELAEVRAGRWPEISFRASGSYIFNPMDALALSPDEVWYLLDPPWDPPAAGESDSLTLLPRQESTHYQFSVNITQPVFTWGKISNAIRLHELLVEVSSLRLEEKQNEIRTRTEILVRSLNLLNEMANAAREQYELCRRLVEIARESFQEGLILEEQVLSARVQFREMELGVREIESTKRRVFAELVRITGTDELAFEEVVFPERIDFLNQGELPGKERLLELALDGQERPSLQILGLLREVQEYAVKISRGSAYWKPDVALQVDLGYQGPRFPFVETDWYRENDHNVTVTIALETTLWDGGKQLQEVRSAREQEKAAEISIDRAKGEITEELTRRYLKYQVNVSRIEYNELRCELLDSRIASASRQYESGVIGEAELIEKQIEGYFQRIASLEEHMEALQHYFIILHMTGAG